MDTTLTEALARFAVELDDEALPESAREHARWLLLDAIACALAGDLGDETALYTEFAREVGGAGEATVIGQAEPRGKRHPGQMFSE